MAVRLFVGNLPYDTTEEELRDHFSAVGPLSYVSIPRDRETGKPRGFAFVEFNDPVHAQEATRRFNNQSFKGRAIAVNEARAREGGPRPGAPARPPLPRPVSTPHSSIADLPPPADKMGRSFGPDAAPRRNRGKAKGGPKSERAPKGPMREVVRGRFFGGDDDDIDDDLNEENFASRVDEDESEDT
jgi:RNA recognition motif-containing protein